MQYDVLIVGAGLGGLTAGAKLAREGKRVLVLEQHDRPGGCATTFIRKDFIMEVGLHEMDGLHRADPKTRIFNELGITERVEFLEVPEFYRFVNDRLDIVVPHDPEAAKSILKKHFPGEEEGIEKYFHTVLNARKVLKEMPQAEDKSLGGFLDEIIGDEDLKLVLLGNLGYFHDDPYSLSWIYYINAQGAYYGGGRANFIKGGSQELSNALMNIIEENGGEVKLNSLVTAIDYEGKIPSGVTYRDSLRKDPCKCREKAREIIINSSVPGLAAELLPETERSALLEEIENNRPGASLLTVYYGFEKSLKEVGSRNYSTFVFDGSVKSQKDILANNHSDFSTRSFTFVDYSQVDSALAPEGKSVGAVCCVDYPEDWEQLSREEYRMKKALVADIFTSRLDKLIPGFRDAVEHVEVGTSLSVRRYTLNPGGAVYGFAQNPGKSISYLSALPSNMHIASAWGKFGGGFSGAILCGYMTALDVLRRG
ncbi:MAG: NAD(P)/FAD-dependent oxidoreductase [Bacteroidales bacterium]|nr:NAD(P)/FAD-dependent oxidoreductase [Bacteroidales bacterium]